MTVKRQTQCKICSPSPKKRSRISEKRVEFHLKAWADEGIIPMYTSWDKPISDRVAAACAARRPDFLFDFKDWILNIENDERAHKDRDPRCEHIRIQDITNAFGQIPIYVLRLNPDNFTIGDTKPKPDFIFRMELLLQRMQNIIANPTFEHHITIEYLFYDCFKCATPTACSYRYVDQFKTMVDYGKYIDSYYPLESVGSNLKSGPSLEAKHVKKIRNKQQEFFTD
jgi:hypothetical protein